MGTYRAGDIIIAAAGKVNHQELLRLLDGLFTQVPPGKIRHGSRQTTYEKKLTVVEKDLEQVHLCLGTRALPQNHQRRYEAYILNTVLGGSMSSRLFQEVREKLGLAYSIYSYMSSHSDTGSLAVYAGTSLDRLGDVINIVLRELRRLKTELCGFVWFQGWNDMCQPGDKTPIRPLARLIDTRSTALIHAPTWGFFISWRRARGWPGSCTCVPVRRERDS